MLDLKIFFNEVANSEVLRHALGPYVIHGDSIYLFEYFDDFCNAVRGDGFVGTDWVESADFMWYNMSAKEREVI